MGDATLIKQSKDELLKHLEEQFQFIFLSSISFDKGCLAEAKRLATCLRTLLQDTNKSVSLLRQLDMKNIDFYDTAGTYNTKIHWTAYHPLASVLYGEGSIPKYFAPLDSVPKENIKWIPFTEWWNKKVIVDSSKNKFSRERLLRYVANQDGGAHVDPSLDEKYYQLSRKNALGEKYFKNGKWFDMERPELASIRQMAHEVQTTLLKHYPTLNKFIDPNKIKEVEEIRKNWKGYSIGGEMQIISRSE